MSGVKIAVGCILGGLLLGWAGALLAVWMGLTPSRPGETIRFQVMDPSVRAKAVLPAVEGRLREDQVVVRESGPSEISVWYPITPALRKAKNELSTAITSLESSTPSKLEVEKVMALSDAERLAALQSLIPASSPDRSWFDDWAQAESTLQAVKAQEAAYPLGQAPEEIRRKKFDAERSVDTFRGSVDQKFVDPGRLEALLKLSGAGDAEVEAELAALRTRYSSQTGGITAVIDAYGRWRAAGGGKAADDEEIERVLAQRGIVEFRIALRQEDRRQPAGEDYVKAMESLQRDGPGTVLELRDGKAAWYRVSPGDEGNFRGGDSVTSMWAGGLYILCYADSLHTLTHSDPSRRPWSLSASRPFEEAGGTVLPFSLNAVGAKYMNQVSGDNKGHPMAILLDDEVMSAPNINSAISDSGIITFGIPTVVHPAAAIEKEAKNLYRILSVDPLPAALRRIK